MTFAIGSLEKLIMAVREDPELFHSITFRPEEAITKLDFLSREEKAMIVSFRAEDIVGSLIGLVVDRDGVASVCGDSCKNSCGATCGAGSCANTCESSCGGTCGAASCDNTTSVLGRGVIVLPGIDRVRGLFRPRARVRELTREF